jgi:hypothetical protein
VPSPKHRTCGRRRSCSSTIRKRMPGKRRSSPRASHSTRFKPSRVLPRGPPARAWRCDASGRPRSPAQMAPSSCRIETDLSRVRRRTPGALPRTTPAGAAGRPGLFTEETVLQERFDRPLRGMRAPDRRASLSAMATACFRFRTLAPDDDRSERRLYSRITLETFPRPAVFDRRLPRPPVVFAIPTSCLCSRFLPRRPPGSG